MRTYEFLSEISYSYTAILCEKLSHSTPMTYSLWIIYWPLQ